MKIILDLCGGTGSWSQPYADAGYKVIIVDPTRAPYYNVLTYRWPHRVHGVLAAPPCTHFAGSGAQWWEDHDAQGLTARSVELVRACLKIIKATKPEWWCLENPVGRIQRLVPELGPPRYIYQPFWYGDPFSKKTCLWGDFWIPTKYQNIVRPKHYVLSNGKKMPPNWRLGGKSESTKRERSRTAPGFAQAFFLSNP